MIKSLINYKTMKESVAFLLLLFFAAGSFAQPLTLQSPDGKLQVNVEIKERISFSVSHEQTEVVAASPVSMTLSDGTVWGVNPKLKNKKIQRVNQTITKKVKFPRYIMNLF